MTQPSKSDAKAADSKGDQKVAAAKADLTKDEKTGGTPATKTDAKNVTDVTKDDGVREPQRAAEGHYARLGTSDPRDADYIRQVGYREDDNHVPDPFFQYGTLDTSDTAGGAHSRIQEISPVFDVARARNLEAAQAALDPNDPTPAELVTLPEEVNTADLAKDRLDAAVADVRDNPIEVGGPTEQQKLAAEGDGEDGLGDEGKTESKPGETKKTD